MKKILFILSILCFIPLTVNAKSEAYYTTKNGVDLTKEQYNNLLKTISIDELNNLDKQTLEKVKNDDILHIEKETKYYKTDYIDNLAFDYEITKELAMVGPEVMPLGSSSGVHTTSYKELTLLTVSSVQNGHTYLTITSTLHWLKEPANKSVDVWAIRFDTPQPYAIESDQYDIYFKAVTAKEESWTLAGDDGIVGDFQLKTYGFANPFYLDWSKIDSRWVVRLRFDDVKPSLVRVTYQHAQGTIDLPDVTNYDIDPSGYGGVILFKNATLRNLYDQMGGVQVTPNFN